MICSEFIKAYGSSEEADVLKFEYSKMNVETILTLKEHPMSLFNFNFAFDIQGFNFKNANYKSQFYKIFFYLKQY